MSNKKNTYSNASLPSMPLSMQLLNVISAIFIFQSVSPRNLKSNCFVEKVIITVKLKFANNMDI